MRMGGLEGTLMSKTASMSKTIVTDNAIRKEIAWEVLCDYIPGGFGNMPLSWQRKVSYFIDENYGKIWDKNCVNRKRAGRMMDGLLEGYIPGEI